jgi:hypothetical protein
MASAPQQTLARLMDGYLTTQLLYMAARLGIADALADGPKTGEQLAREVGADPTLLTRALRGLALEDVVVELDGGAFALGEVGACLRTDVPGSMRGPVLARGDLYFRAAEALLPAVREGQVPFELVHGEAFFAHLKGHPERESAFQASMAGRSQQEAADVVAAYDFGGVRTLVDVGGGGGILLEAILAAAPALRGILFDRPGVIPDARRRLQGTAVADRAELVAGDFFEAVPAGAEAYVLSRVVHDWDDDDARRILRSVRAAMEPGSRLLVIEAILPERAHDQPGAIRMDLNMMMLFPAGARERTEVEFRRLLTDAGLAVQRVIPTRSPVGISVVEATVS